MCNLLELSKFLVCLGDLLSFSVPGGTEKIAGLWFAKGGQYPGWHYANEICDSRSPAILLAPLPNFKSVEDL